MIVSPCCVTLSQVDQLGSEVLNREAYTILHEMEPLYRIIQARGPFLMVACFNRH